MSKTALVLSGGGALGAFQMAAEKYAREVKGYEWDIIAGVSVGALNGVMLAMKKYDRLNTLWKTISNGKIYTGKMNFWAAVRLLFGAKSVFNNKPLWNILQREVEPDKIVIDLRIGVVSLWTGEYEIFKPGDAGFAKGVLASTAIPIIWSPVQVSAAHRDLVDGGVRNISPLGDVLDSDPDEIVIINCHPRKPGQATKPLKNALDIGMRSLDIAMNELMITDIREFIRINKNVEEAAKAGVTLHNEDDKPFKYYKYKLIEPDAPLGDPLDFSTKSVGRSMKLGLAAAKKELGP